MCSSILYVPVKYMHLELDITRRLIYLQMLSIAGGKKVFSCMNVYILFTARDKHYLIQSI